MAFSASRRSVQLRLRLVFATALSLDVALIAIDARRLGVLSVLRHCIDRRAECSDALRQLGWAIPLVLALLWIIAEGLALLATAKTPSPPAPGSEAGATASRLVPLMALPAGLVIGVHAGMLFRGNGAGEPRMFALVFSLFSIAFGITVAGIRPNLLVGLRTPWTLADPEVWRLTHRWAAAIMAAAGALGIAGSALLPGSLAAAFSILVFLAGIGACVWISSVVARKRR